MPQTPTNLFARPDTMLGVCEGLGQDLGIHPNLLRIAFGAAIFFAPMAAVAVYLSLGLLVAATRYAFPDLPAVPSAERVGPADTAVEAQDEELRLAA